MSSARLLFVQHADDCPPGWFGEEVRKAGADFDVVHGGRNEHIPSDLGSYAGLVVLGGDMGAHDDSDNAWLAPTKQLISTVVHAGRCFLGICLGHQLAALALGGDVIRNPHGQSTGLTPVALTSAGRCDPLLSCVSPEIRAIQWNSDVVARLPEGAELLATSPDGTVQAARYGECAWGVQFHPEVSPAIFSTWTVDMRSASVPPNVDLADLARDVSAAEPELRRAWAPLATRFTELARQPQHAS